MKIVALLAVLMLSAPLLAAGTVYRWVDENGQTHFSQTPPPKGRYDVIQPSGGTRSQGVPEGTEVPPASGQSGESGADEQRQRTQRFLEEADARNRAKAEAKAKATQEKAEAARKCAEARQRHQFLEERTARRLVDVAPDGNYTRITEEDFLQRLDAAQKNIDSYCR